MDDRELAVTAPVVESLIWDSYGYTERAAAHFRASMANGTKETVYLVYRSLARIVTNNKRRFNPALGHPWYVGDICPMQNRAQGWAAQFCVAIGNQNEDRAIALFDSIAPPQHASENMAALFTIAGEVIKQSREKDGY